LRPWTCGLNLVPKDEDLRVLSAALRASSASQPDTRTMKRQTRRMSTIAERKAAGQTPRRIFGTAHASDAAVRAEEFAGVRDALGVARRQIAWTDDDRAAAPWRYLADLVAPATG
jgi:hypothetical protein